MPEFQCSAFDLNTDLRECIQGEYNDPVHGFVSQPALMGNLPEMIGDQNGDGQFGAIDVYLALGRMQTGNYNLYCYDEAVACFSNCGGAMNQACSNACNNKLRHCCTKTNLYENDPLAGNICGMENTENPDYELFYYDCTCFSPAIETQYPVTPPKAIPKWQKQKTENELRSGGTAPNKLRKNMRKRRKCGFGEIRLPNGNCIQKNNNNNDVMAHGNCCNLNRCEGFSVRVTCEVVEQTCMNPQGCFVDVSDSGGDPFGDPFGWENSGGGGSYAYGETYVTNQFNFEPLSGGGFGCSGGCTLAGGSLEYACLGIDPESSMDTNSSVCGTVTSCNCACTESCGSSTPSISQPPKMF